MVYSRIDAPGRARAEALVSELEGGHAVLYASGLAALWAAMVFYTPARLVLDAGYHGTLYAVHRPRLPYSDAKKTNRDVRVWHGATENGT
jgi:cystathionine beta-lyase/cystathionine gamma-synthase